MNRQTTAPLAPNEISYLLEAQIRGLNPNRLTAVCFGQQDVSYLRPPERPNRSHNPFGEDFCLSTLAIGARGA
jgi:hypothetical protein